MEVIMNETCQKWRQTDINIILLCVANAIDSFKLVEATKKKTYLFITKPEYV